MWRFTLTPAAPPSHLPPPTHPLGSRSRGSGLGPSIEQFSNITGVRDQHHGPSKRGRKTRAAPPHAYKHIRSNVREGDE